MEIIGKLVAEDLDHQPFVWGKQWNGVPICHEIMRNEYWIYTCNNNIKFKTYLGLNCVFFCLPKLPSEQEANTLEWRTVDLLNSLQQYSRMANSDVLRDLSRALAAKKLNAKLLEQLANAYGTAQTKKLVDCAKFVANVD